MVRIKDLGNGNYQTFPETDDMIEVEDIDAWVKEHTPPETTARIRVEELKQLLVDTDYVITKIQEAMVEDEGLAEELKVKYAGTLADRKAWRAEINELQNRYNIE